MADGRWLFNETNHPGINGQLAKAAGSGISLVSKSATVANTTSAPAPYEGVASMPSTVVAYVADASGDITYPSGVGGNMVFDIYTYTKSSESPLYPAVISWTPTDSDFWNSIAISNTGVLVQGRYSAAWGGYYAETYNSSSNSKWCTMDQWGRLVITIDPAGEASYDYYNAVADVTPYISSGFALGGEVGYWNRNYVYLNIGQYKDDILIGTPTLLSRSSGATAKNFAGIVT